MAINLFTKLIHLNHHDTLSGRYTILIARSNWQSLSHDKQT